MNIFKNRVKKVLSEINSENEGISQYKLGRKLNEKYSDSLSFSNFDEFIQINILTGRLMLKDDKLFITERGRRVVNSYLIDGEEGQMEDNLLKEESKVLSK